VTISQRTLAALMSAKETGTPSEGVVVPHRPGPMSMRVWGFGAGAGVGWALAIVLMAGLRQKMGYANIPAPFQGVAVTMIVIGVMALAFMGFAGMVSIQ